MQKSLSGGPGIQRLQGLVWPCALALLVGWLEPAFGSQSGNGAGPGAVEFVLAKTVGIGGSGGGSGSGPAMPTVEVPVSPVLVGPASSAQDMAAAGMLFDIDVGGGATVLSADGGGKNLTLAVAGAGGALQSPILQTWTFGGHLHAAGLSGDNGDVRLSGVAFDGGVDVGFPLWQVTPADNGEAQFLRGFVGLSGQYLALSGDAATGSAGGRVDVHYEAFSLNLRTGLQYQHFLTPTWYLLPALVVSARVYTRQLTPHVATNINEGFGDRLSGTLRLDLGYLPFGSGSASGIKFGLGITYAKNALAAQAGLGWQFY